MYLVASSPNPACSRSMARKAITSSSVEFKPKDRLRCCRLRHNRALRTGLVGRCSPLQVTAARIASGNSSSFNCSGRSRPRKLATSHATGCDSDRAKGRPRSISMRRPHFTGRSPQMLESSSLVAAGFFLIASRSVTWCECVPDLRRTASQRRFALGGRRGRFVATVPALVVALLKSAGQDGPLLCRGPCAAVSRGRQAAQRAWRGHGCPS